MRLLRKQRRENHFTFDRYVLPFQVLGELDRYTDVLIIFCVQYSEPLDKPVGEICILYTGGIRGSVFFPQSGKVRLLLVQVYVTDTRTGL